jgi:L-rhamnose mutarotase
MIKTIILSMCLAASSLSLDARAQDALAEDALAQNDRQYTDGPVTEVDYIQVEYGHFAEYIDWLNSTWKPTMEALKKAGIIIDYKVFQASPKSPDQPNMFLMLTFKNMAAYAGDIGDKGIELEYVARKVICSTECQNKARVVRNGYRKVLGTELIRELILK